MLFDSSQKSEIPRPDVISHPAKKFSDVLKDVLKEYPEESFYFLNEGILRDRIQIFQNLFLREDSRRHIAYALKVNPLPELLGIIHQAGIESFDCASVEEILGVQNVAPNASIFFNNPNKRKKDIQQASSLGVCHFTTDTESELEKILESCSPAIKSKLEIAVRLITPNSHAGINLSDKYGVDSEKAKKMLAAINEIGHKCGLSMHVGSQNKNTETYEKGLQAMVAVSQEAGVKLDSLNVGGGIPVFQDKTLEENNAVLRQYLNIISAACRGQIDQILREDAKVIIEPGRSVVSPAVDLVVSIISRKDDREKPVIVMNDGVFGSFSDSLIHKWRYPVKALDGEGKDIEGKTIIYDLHGRTCDSGDTMKDYILPKQLTAKDYLHFPNAGAYMSAQSFFNGFGYHRYVIYNSQKIEF